MNSLTHRTARFSIMVLLVAGAYAQQREAVLNFDPADCSVKFTLGASFHKVHGTFALKSGAIHFDPGDNSLSGEIIVDAKSGNTGNDSRDHKMHKEILESERYPEIVFRAEKVVGPVAVQGTSTVEVHGTFTLHGADHEITIPVQVQLSQDHWTATANFAIPYVQWGIKNPSTFVLRVDHSVDVEVHAAGRNPWLAPGM